MTKDAEMLAREDAIAVAFNDELCRQIDAGEKTDSLSVTSKLVALPIMHSLLAAASPAPDAGLVEREAIARAAHFAGDNIYGEAAFSPANEAHWQHWWVEDRQHHEATVDSILALLSTRAVAWHTAFRKARPQSDEYRNVIPLYTHPAPSGRDPATIEAAVKAVEDAGGDNCEWHVQAIRAILTEER